MITYAYLAVVGRLNGDDEDIVILYQDLTVDAAENAFREDLRQHGREEPVPDCKVYVNYVLTSDSPINITRSFA